MQAFTERGGVGFTLKTWPMKVHFNTSFKTQGDHADMVEEKA